MTHSGSRPGGRAGGRDGSRARTGRAGGDRTGGRDGSVAGGGTVSPDDRRSVAVQLQLSPDGGRRRPRLRASAATSGASGRNRRPSLASRRSAAIRRAAASRRGGSRGLTDGQKVETA